MTTGRREFLIAAAGAVTAVLARGASAACAGTTLDRVACELAERSPDRPAWSGPVIGLDSMNAKVHHWGDPDKGQPILGGRPPFTAPNGVRDDYNILDWPGKAHWDPVRGDWWFSGGPTGNQDSASPTIVRYRPADDRFVHWQGVASRQGGIWPPSGHAHSFDAADLDVQGRRIWRHLTPHRSEAYGFKLGWFDIDTSASGRIDGDGYQNSDYPTIAFLRDSQVLHVIRPQPGTSLNIRRFDVAHRNWIKPLRGPPGSAGPSCYLAGGIYYSTSRGLLARISPDGSVDDCRPCPIAMARPVNGDSRYSIFCPIGNHVFAFCGNGDIWRYSPFTDSWGEAPHDRIPWQWPNVQFSSTGRHYLSKTCVGPVPPLGVALVCLAQRSGRSGGVPARACVWKP